MGSPKDALSKPHPDQLAPPPIFPAAKSKSPVGERGTAQQSAVAKPPPSMLVGLLQKIALAGISNMIGTCVVTPFDLVKVRQQVEAGKSTPWTITMREMITKEGPTSLYKGLTASLMREATYSGIRMGAYDICKAGTLAAVPWANESSFGVKLTAGALSGIIGAGIANPCDLVKVRMQTVGATGSLRHHISTVYSTGGIAGFYRGFLPTIARAGVLTSAQMGVYDYAKHTLMDDFPTVFREGFKTHLAASGIAGIAAILVSNPFDVVKSRMMSDKSGQYRGVVHCTITIMRTGGPLAFYKGVTMAVLRLWPHSVLSLLMFEQLRKLTGIAPI